MILLRLTLFMTALFMLGCDSSTKVPSASRQNYPLVIKDSAERRTKAEREWRRLLDVYSIAQTPPDLNPITYTPRSLLGVTGGLKIVRTKIEPGTESTALRVAMKLFIERWRELIGADPTTVSLIAATPTDGGQRLTYRQVSYPFPVAGNFGEMVAVLSADGRLVQLDDRFIPLVELPLRPAIEREDAARRVLGRSFTYGDIAGREQRVQISSRDEVTVKQLVVLPVEKGDAIEVHLAWEIVVGKSLSWTVYIDAMGGEDLRIVQNFRT